MCDRLATHKNDGNSFNIAGAMSGPTAVHTRRLDVMKRALEILAEMPIGFRSEILKFLDDVDPTVRESALDALSETNNESIIPLLVHIVEADPDEGLRTYALNILGDYHNVLVLKCLLTQASLPESFGRQRQIAANQLGKYDQLEAVDALLVLVEDQDYIVQSNAVHSLLKLNRPNLEAFWRRVIKRTKYNPDYQAAKKALSELRSKESETE